MSDSKSFRDQLLGTTKNPAVSENEYQAYSTVSAQQGPQQKLRLRFKDGTEEALDYSYCYRISLDGGTITMRFTTGEIATIQGTRLNEKDGDRPPLYQALTDHLVRWIHETDPLSLQSAKVESKPVATRLNLATTAD